MTKGHIRGTINTIIHFLIIYLFIEIEYCNVAQVGLKLMNLPPYPPEYCPATSLFLDGEFIIEFGKFIQLD
jgi:hypothetical protein